MEVKIINDLNQTEPVNRAISNIKGEDFLYIYKIMSYPFYYNIYNGELSDADLEQALGPSPLIVHLEKKQDKVLFHFSFRDAIRGVLTLDLFGVDKISFLGEVFKYNEHINKDWQQFLSENLGEKFYKKLLAANIKETLNSKADGNVKEYQSLIEKLAANKRAEEEISKQIEEFNHKYANVLDKNGEVLPIDDDDIKKA